MKAQISSLPANPPVDLLNPKAGQVVDPGDRQSTQALLEELKKSVAPKVVPEERKSEPHGQEIYAKPLAVAGKDEVRSLKVPSVVMNSQDSAFRQGAPNVAIMSLHTHSVDNNLITMQSKEQLSLKDINKKDINMHHLSRYDHNDDDKSVFSKNYKPMNGETLEELQQRIK